jgi:hypothetical protein
LRDKPAYSPGQTRKEALNMLTNRSIDFNKVA